MKTTLLLLLIPSIVFSQYQNLYFTKTGGDTLFATNDYQPGKTSFYIYRNCVYDFVLKDKTWLKAYVHDIRNDSIYYTWFYTSPYSRNPDTFALHPSDIKRIHIEPNLQLFYPAGISLRHMRFNFVNSAVPKAFKVMHDTVAPAIYNLAPTITYDGMKRLNQQTNIIERPVVKDTVKRAPVTRNWVWFTPSGATTVNGLNIGVQTLNTHDQPLRINGVNLNADAGTAMITMYASMYAFALLPRAIFKHKKDSVQTADTLSKYAPEIIIKGLSISGGGLLQKASLRGVSLNGGICMALDAKGVLIAGLVMEVEDFRGITLGGLYNQSIQGNGLQLGLVNHCKRLKGIQVGLWNVNGKRKWPLVNWSF